MREGREGVISVQEFTADPSTGGRGAGNLAAQHIAC